MSELTPSPEAPAQLRSAPQPFTCELRSSGSAAVWIRAAGELDLASAPSFEQAVEKALSSALLVVVDLRALTFIDSTGLHVIMEADARARRSGRRLVIVRGSEQIDRVFALVGLSDRLEIVDHPSARGSAAALCTAQSDDERPTELEDHAGAAE